MDISSWVLIITLSNAGSIYSGKAIEHIPGFISEVACKSAGKTWKNDLSRSDLKLATFSCVNLGR